MTRRILAGFLGVLVGVLALIVVPLGISLSAQHREDFRRAVDGAARSLAALAEEKLGDRADPADRRPLSLPVQRGDTAILLDRTGRLVLVSGPPLPAGELSGFRVGGRSPQLLDAVVARAVVGSGAHPDGWLFVVRDAEPLDHWIARLWLYLAAAAAVALAAGGLVAAGLARWIQRPLRDLRSAALRIGAGDLAARAGRGAGPPEVRDVAAAFDEMADRVGSLLDSHRIVTLDVSHQLRTPLAALRLRLELLVDDLPDELRPELHGALREIARLTRLADGLLAVARAEERSTHPEPIDVAAVVADRVTLWEPVLSEYGLTVSADTDRVRASATPGHLEQVLDNLIANAVEALPPGRHIDVRVRADGPAVALTVADNGRGMAEADRQAAFTPFVGDRSRPSKTGLGLAIVARLLAADHGSARLAETPGGGLTAVIRLPLAAEGPPPGRGGPPLAPSGQERNSTTFSAPLSAGREKTS